MGITLGWPSSIDPGEAVVELRDDRVEGPSANALRVHAAIVNGKPLRDAALPLPAPSVTAASPTPSTGARIESPNTRR